MTEADAEAWAAFGLIKQLLPQAVRGLPRTPGVDALEEVVTWIVEHDDIASLDSDPLVKTVLAHVKGGDYERAAATIRAGKATQ